MKNDDKTKICPEGDELSAGFDGELSGVDLEAFDKHLELCPDCKKQLVSYRRMAESVKKAVSSAVETDLQQRILAGVHEKLDQQNKPIHTEKLWFTPVFLRLAASVIVCAGLGIFVLGKLYNGDGDTGAARTQVVQKEDGLFNSANYKPPKNQKGSVDIANLRVTSTDGQHDAPIKNPKIAGSEKAERISSNVRHVWVVNNLAKVKDDIETFAEKHDIPTNKMLIMENRNKDGIKLNLRLSKKELVDLVNECADSGLELVSPQAPQPDAKSFVGSLDTPVQYNADFILSNK